MYLSQVPHCLPCIQHLMEASNRICTQKYSPLMCLQQVERQALCCCLLPCSAEVTALQDCTCSGDCLLPTFC